MNSEQVLSFFKEITTIPRESGHEEKIVAYLQEFAAKNNLECKTDDAGNVLIGRMRGYYYGRFNGNTLVTTQLELRQRVWEGLVVVGWGGCGTAFSKGDPASWNKVLPTYGAGLRWYFSPTSLVRVDYGMGKGCSAFVVGYSEAF